VSNIFIHVLQLLVLGSTNTMNCIDDPERGFVDEENSKSSIFKATAQSPVVVAL
jgi:hypothetical protein